MKKIWLLLLLPLVCLTSCTCGGDDEDYDIIKVGDKVPAFHIDRDVIGGEYFDFTSPDDFLGKNTLLVFFTTKCPDCQREMPFAKRIWDEMGTEEVNVVGISRGFNSDYPPHKFWEDYKMGAAEWYLDTDGTKAYGKFATGYVPRFYLVDETGTVVWMAVEDLGYGKYTEANGDKFVKLVKEKLKL